MTEPTTQAGRALRVWAEREHSVGNFIAGQFLQIVEAIGAIEAEAAEKARAEVLRNEGLGQIIADALADRDAARAEVAMLREALKHLAHVVNTVPPDSMTRWNLGEAYEHAATALAANPADWLAKHDEAVIRGLFDQNGPTSRRFLDLASPDTERRLAAALASIGGVARPQPQGAARAILAALRAEPVVPPAGRQPAEPVE